MKAQIVKLNKTLAKELLAKNNRNRKVKENTLNSYISQMLNGLWKENGEPIIIDSNGVVKDGQHRLLAVVKTDYSYNVPLITNVSPDVMDTIDTGTNRSAGDVLHLNGFKYSSLLSAAIKKILAYNHNLSLSRTGYQTKRYFTNSVILEFASKHEDELYEIVRNCESLYVKNNSVFAHAEFILFAYVIGGLKPNEQHYDFLKHLAGVKVDEGDATSYIRNLLIKAKTQKTSLNKTWILALVIKSYNSYCIGNPQVKYLKHDMKREFPKPIELN
jgi:hypothetical protein